VKRKARRPDRRVFVRWLVAALLITTGDMACHAAELTFDLKVEHGRVPESTRLIRVKEGDVVTLRWTADRPLLLHLHGYDIEKRVLPGIPTELTFTAYASGRFPIHVHGAGETTGGQQHAEAPLVFVEVYPR